VGKILLFGASGQLGRAVLNQRWSGQSKLVPAPRSLRLDDHIGLATLIAAERPDWVINAAAMTDVDGAHLDPDKALRVNGLAPGVLARTAQEVGARVIHISSEAVYDGSSEMLYTEADACRPVSVYGASKLAGDLLTLTYSPDSFVLRTSWLYSTNGGSNFPTRILDQLAVPKKEISVVTDIVGNPTPTAVLVNAVVAILASPPEPGLYHVCALGSASKFDWAVEIARSAGHDPSRIVEVTSDNYTTVAKRPKYVDLDCSKFLATGMCALPQWRDAWVEHYLT
jgi:dTDP-4-dehydrorhamnose reductase